MQNLKVVCLMQLSAYELLHCGEAYGGGECEYLMKNRDSQVEMMKRQRQDFVRALG
jgi:hypothetical protein